MSNLPTSPTPHVSDKFAPYLIDLQSDADADAPACHAIAAHALTINATPVSADAAFGRVPGLQVENWLTDFSAPFKVPSNH